MVSRNNKILLPVILISLITGFFVPSSVFADPPELNCRQKFFKSLKGFFAGEDTSKSTYSFTPEELTEVNEFLTKPSEVQLLGFNEKMLRFQNLALKRYAMGLDSQAVNAFGKLNDFWMVDGNFSAEVKIYSKENKLFVEIPNVRAQSAGTLGNVSKGLDVGLAHFFATVTKGIEYRLFLNKGINAVEILPSKVVNKKLKIMLHEFGFKKISEMPDWGEVRGIRSGMGPAAEFKIELTTDTRTH